MCPEHRLYSQTFSGSVHSPATYQLSILWTNYLTSLGLCFPIYKNISTCITGLCECLYYWFWQDQVLRSQDRVFHLYILGPFYVSVVIKNGYITFPCGWPVVSFTASCWTLTFTSVICCCATNPSTTPGLQITPYDAAHLRLRNSQSNQTKPKLD